MHGIDSDNGVEFINDQLLRYCTREKITFTRSRPGTKNEGAHVEQKNWTVVRHDIAAKQDQLKRPSAVKGHSDQTGPAAPTRAS